MNLPRATTCILLTATLAIAAAPASAKKNRPSGEARKAATCTTPSHSYDSGGAPGSGPVNDPLFSRQWGLEQVNAPAAWARGALGATAVVAVIDTGVDLPHPDLQGKLLAGADFVAGKTDCPPGPQDENGHGTHVAGIAAATTDNSIGVAGTAPGASILPVRVLDASGNGTIDDVVAGIRWAADRGADVLNLSIGELPVVGQAEALNRDVEAAVDYAWSRGSLVVAAAGNETFPLCSYPAAARRAVCVAATDRRGLPTYYSNFPADPDAAGGDFVGVRAPGGAGTVSCEDDEDVWSTIWPGSDLDCQGRATLTGRPFQSGYDTLAGTSMATPFVSGVAALLAGQGLTNQQIRDRIKARSSNRGAYYPVYGHGIVDADAATG